jgi:hypothetical protein
MNINPMDPDAALGDGVPLRVKAGLGLAALDLVEWEIAQVGVDASGQAVVTWRAVPGGAGAVIQPAGRGVKASATAEVGYQVQRSPDLTAWLDVLDRGVLTYDPVRNEFKFTDTSGASGRGFYRYRVFWNSR